MTGLVEVVAHSSVPVVSNCPSVFCAPVSTGPSGSHFSHILGWFSEALPSRMEMLSSALDAAVNASLVKNDTNQPYFLPPLAQANATPYTSMIMRGAPGTSGSSSYANFRYYAEMLSSGYFSDDIAHAISEFRETHTGTLSGMTRFLDHLDDMP